VGKAMQGNTEPPSSCPAVMR